MISVLLRAHHSFVELKADIIVPIRKLTKSEARSGGRCALPPQRADNTEKLVQFYGENHRYAFSTQFASHRSLISQLGTVNAILFALSRIGSHALSQAMRWLQLGFRRSSVVIVANCKRMSPGFVFL